MQNAFLEPGTLLEAPSGRDIIARLAKLIEVCRELGVPVIWVRLDSNAPYGGLLLDKYPSLREQRVLFKGTHSFEFFRICRRRGRTSIISSSINMTRFTVPT